MIRILIADDHSIVRQGLKQIVSECPGMAVTGEAESGSEALELVRTQDFDVAILDIAMPGRGGLEVLKDLRAQKPSLKVMVLSMYSEEQYAIRSFRDGASAYLTKGSAPDELVEAIQAVAAGRRYITPAVADRLAGYLDQGAVRPLHETLSDRELQVLVLLGAGKSVRDIAGELSLSVKTISTYRTRILGKLGVGSTAELIRYAIGQGIVS
jgi:DNA-binding NarL/FixJ family response regulator